jgi:hypothetical protein
LEMQGIGGRGDFEVPIAHGAFDGDENAALRFDLPSEGMVVHVTRSPPKRVLENGHDIEAVGKAVDARAGLRGMAHRADAIAAGRQMFKRSVHVFVRRRTP